MVPISVVIIAKNEVDRIASTLDSVSWAAEILVVDSGSSDGTKELVVSKGCRLMEHVFEGYGKQKQFAVKNASYDWIFALDADEVVSDALAKEIQSLFTSDPGNVCFNIPRQLVFMGHKMRFGGEAGKLELRIFNRKFGSFNDALVHEKVITTSPIRKLKGILLHYSYRDLSDYLRKFDIYTTKGALERYKQGKKKSLAYIMMRQNITFWQMYFFKGLIFDGFPGFIWSLLSSIYPVVKYTKVIELYSKRTKV